MQYWSSLQPESRPAPYALGPDLCLGIGILPTLALDYAIAFYPFLLMIISYLLIVLYDRNYRIVTLLWRPFIFLFSLFRKNWDIRTNIMDAFATFFFLSNTKLFSVSLDLLLFTRVNNVSFDNLNYSTRLFYAAEIEYFDKQHLPYVILSIVVLSIFVLVPIIVLMLYPFSFFQKLLHLFPFRWHVLHTFVNSFYRCYKDGTQPGTRDYRWFVAVFFFFRVLNYSIYSLCDSVASPILITLSIHLLVMLLAAISPFSSAHAHHNILLIIFLQFLSGTLIAGSAATPLRYLSHTYVFPMYMLGYFFGAAPTLCTLVASIFLCTCHRKSFGRKIFVGIKGKLRGYGMLGTASSESLPDRMVNHQYYQRNHMANFVSRSSKS